MNWYLIIFFVLTLIGQLNLLYRSFTSKYWGLEVCFTLFGMALVWFLLFMGGVFTLL